MRRFVPRRRSGHRAIIATKRVDVVDILIFSAWLNRDIAGMVAAMTEDDPGVESERVSYNIPG